MFYTAQSGLKQHTRHTSTLDLLVLWTRSEEAADRWFRVLEAARRYQLAMAEEEEEWVGVLLGGRRDDVDTHSSTPTLTRLLNIATEEGRPMRYERASAEGCSQLAVATSRGLRLTANICRQYCFRFRRNLATIHARRF